MSELFFNLQVVIDKLKKELIEKEENLRSLVGKTREENNMKKSMENNIAEVCA